MKRTRTSLKCLLALVVTLFLSLIPQTTWAECTLQTTSNYTVMLEGTNQMRIKFPAYSIYPDHVHIRSQYSKYPRICIIYC